MEEQENAENVNTVSANTDVSDVNVTVTNAADEVSAPVPAEPEAAEAEETTAENDAPAAAAEEEEKHFTPRTRKPVTPDMLERSQKDLMKMFDFLGFENATVKASEENGDIILLVESEDAGRIIGRKGQTLESIQLLLNRMMQKDDLEFPRILISIDGYSTRHPDSRGHGRDRGDEAPRGDRGDRRPRHGGRRDDRHGRFSDHERRDNHRGNHSRGGDDGDREEILRQQALDAAKEVRRWGEPKTLPPMNAHDRRMIHITLENEADLQTESEGEGAIKSIVISLKK